MCVCVSLCMLVLCVYTCSTMKRVWDSRFCLTEWADESWHLTENLIHRSPCMSTGESYCLFYTVKSCHCHRPNWVWGGPVGYPPYPLAFSPAKVQENTAHQGGISTAWWTRQVPAVLWNQTSSRTPLTLVAVPFTTVTDSRHLRKRKKRRNLLWFNPQGLLFQVIKSCLLEIEQYILYNSWLNSNLASNFNWMGRKNWKWVSVLIQLLLGLTMPFMLNQTFFLKQRLWIDLH